MKAAFAIVALMFVSEVYGQSTTLSGVIYDPSGAVVVGAEVKAISPAGKVFISKSNSEGAYSLEVPPGVNTLYISRSGFITLRIAEYFVIQSTLRKMQNDFVLFGSRSHEPCGYGGANCLSKKDLVEEITVTAAPNLKTIRY